MNLFNDLGALAPGGVAAGLPQPLLLVLAALSGLLVGALHFGGLHWFCQRLVRPPTGGARGWAPLLLLHLGRFALLVLALAGAARLGALPLLAMTVGVLVARALMLRSLGRAP